MHSRIPIEGPFPIIFPRGRRAWAVHAQAQLSATKIAATLELPSPRAVLLISGGASTAFDSDKSRWHALLTEGVAQVAAEQTITIIDGGTQVDLFRQVGQGIAARRGNGPMIGVCPAALVSWPGGPAGDGRVPLEPNHTHFVLTPGDRWGAETQIMFALAATLSADAPSLAILVDGGRIARHEILHNVSQGREIIALRGSGRLADQIAAARDAPERVQYADLAQIAAYRGLTVLDESQSPRDLANLIRHKLTGGQHG